MSLITNLDQKLTRAQRVKHERHEQRQEFIDERIKRAERAKYEQGHDSPDVIFEDIQDPNVTTADSAWDRDPKSLHNRTSLPVKQYIIRRDGVLVKELSEAASEAVRLKLFCFRCEERQPEDAIRQRESWARMGGIGFKAVGAAPGDNCAYCSAKLGFHSDEGEVGAVTSEQQRLIEQLTSKR